MKNIYCFVWPSGCGKTTIVEALREEYGYRLIESYTTRPPRHSEETGYTFVSPEEFKALGEMYAYTEFDGYEYGVTADLIERNDLYVVDPAGVGYLRDQYHGEKGIRVVGLTAPVDVLSRRMKQRGDSDEKILRRLSNDFTVFRNLGSISDIYIDARSSVADICEVVHEFIEFHERQAAYTQEASLGDNEDKTLDAVIDTAVARCNEAASNNGKSVEQILE